MQASGAVARGLWTAGSVVVVHNSQRCSVAREVLHKQESNTHVLCVGKWVLSHWTTKEVLYQHLWRAYFLQSPDKALHG